MAPPTRAKPPHLAPATCGLGPLDRHLRPHQSRSRCGWWATGRRPPPSRSLSTWIDGCGPGCNLRPMGTRRTPNAVEQAFGGDMINAMLTQIQVKRKGRISSRPYNHGQSGTGRSGSSCRARPTCTDQHALRRAEQPDHTDIAKKAHAA